MINKAPYGKWDSFLSAKLATASQKRFHQIYTEQDCIYWEEGRPSEGGRTTILKRDKNGEIHEILPTPFSCRTKVLEYGGSSFAIHKEELYFINEKDQRLYYKEKPISPEGIRLADIQVIEGAIVAVAEEGNKHSLALIDPKKSALSHIAEGHDFYASPTFSPSGKKIAFLTWDLSQMPWDGTCLWIGDFLEGKIENIKQIAGGKEESIFQPQWSPEGNLFFISDRSGFWNVYEVVEGKIVAVCPKQAEFGLPQWIFGLSTYTFIEGRPVAAYQSAGKFTLCKLKPFEEIPLPETHFSQLRALKEKLVCITGSGKEGKRVALIDLKKKKIETLAHSPTPLTSSLEISEPEFISFPSKEGRVAYGFYYPPKNPHFEAPENSLPPLIVKSHGGPTSYAQNTLDPKVQYWTSRGFGVVDVDYGGSSGYGRAYRNLLRGKWGIIDVEDCEAAAHFLIAQKKADPKRVAITGSSAGGFTTLAALTFGKTFTVGSCYYGVSDLSLLAEETHKFEAHYLDLLIGPYPQEKKLYQERSPLFSVDKLHCPVIFFQGDQDKVVPLNQTETLYEALKKRGILTEFVLFSGEGHGFRKAENLETALEKELAFFLKAWNML